MEIVPRKSVGPIKFGMSLVQVREKLGAPIKSFLRSPHQRTSLRCLQ